jgi:hypothetical protein
MIKKMERGAKTGIESKKVRKKERWRGVQMFRRVGEKRKKWKREEI